MCPECLTVDSNDGWEQCEVEYEHDWDGNITRVDPDETEVWICLACSAICHPEEINNPVCIADD